MPETVRLFLKRNANVGLKEFTGMSPLHGAAMNCSRSAEIVELLCRNVPSIDEKDESGDTALLLAVKYGHVDATEVLYGIKRMPGCATTETRALWILQPF